MLKQSDHEAAARGGRGRGRGGYRGGGGGRGGLGYDNHRDGGGGGAFSGGRYRPQLGFQRGSHYRGGHDGSVANRSIRLVLISSAPFD